MEANIDGFDMSSSAKTAEAFGGPKTISTLQEYALKVIQPLYNDINPAKYHEICLFTANKVADFCRTQAETPNEAVDEERVVSLAIAAALNKYARPRANPVDFVVRFG